MEMMEQFDMTQNKPLTDVMKVWAVAIREQSKVTRQVIGNLLHGLSLFRMATR